MALEIFEVQGQEEPPNLTLKPVTSFFVGSRVCSAAWSPSTAYEGDNKEWRLDIVVATELMELRLLEAYGPDGSSTQRKLGDTHARINDLVWCPTPGYESFVVAGTASGVVQVWNLESNETDSTELAASCKQLYLDSSVLSVSFHPRIPKLLFTLESSGVGRMIDWLASDEELRTVVTFYEPYTLGAHTTQLTEAQGAGAWQSQDSDIMGALLGSRWCVWNVSEGNPVEVASGVLHSGVHSSHESGGFRFCPTNSRLFALYTSSVPSQVLSRTGFQASSSRLTDNSAAVYVVDSALPTSARPVDVHYETPMQGRSVLLDSTGCQGQGTLPCAYGASSMDWIPRQVGAYDVLLVSVGRRLIPVPVA
ncbi:hypothetical protein MNAN1_003080 [Malassezia nana]|uniref:Uncharacterized protein n=1 Tax=Malassezia nana TaxID=180528 RepID=A0AAF0J3J3_9BASI|nr:hypothetical protein MNAN1_003080 [Malassezia nana]